MDTLEQDLAAEFDKDFAPQQFQSHPRGAMAEFAQAREVVVGGRVVKSRDGEAEIQRRFQPADAASTSADPIARQAEVHRKAVAKHHAAMLSIERSRDIAVRGYEADLAEASRAFAVEEARLTRLIADAKSEATRRLAIRKQLSRSSEAALMALEPSSPARSASISERLVPRVVQPGEPA